METKTVRVIAEVFITPKSATMDTTGDAKLKEMHSRGYPMAKNVRAGKVITIELDAPSVDAARVIVAGMCVKFLANPVIEDFRIEVKKAMMKKERVWLQFAAHGPNIKGDKTHGWRCNFVDAATGKLSEEILLTGCELSGVASPHNFIVKNNAQGGTGMDGVVGWLEIFCNAVIDEKDVLHATLQIPAAR